MPPVSAAASGANAAGKIGNKASAEVAKKADLGKATNISKNTASDLRQNAAADLRNHERNAENGGDSEENSGDVNYTGDGSGRQNTASNNSRLNIGNIAGKLNLQGLIKGAPVILSLGVVLVPILLLFGTGSLLFADIDENTMESMDVQYVAMRKAAEIATGKALANGSIPSTFAKNLTDSGLEVGYLDNSGTFIAGLRPSSDTTIASTAISDSIALNNPSLTVSSSSDEDSSLVLRFKDRIINASEWLAAVETDPEVYKAFDEATYGRAMGHYDNAAELFYSNINASRNIFANFSSTDETRDFREILGEYYTSNPDNIYEVEPNDTAKTKGATTQTGNATKDAIDAYLDELYENTVVDADDSDWESGKRHDESQMFYDKAQAATIAYLVNNALNANETYESMKYFLMLEEVMSKTKAGDGATAPANEMLNYFTTADETGLSAVQSPTLSSVLTKSFDGYYSDDESKNEIKPFSIDRVHQTIKDYASAIDDDYLKFALSIAGISWSQSSSNPYGIKDNEHSILKLLPEETEPTPPACVRYPATSEYYDSACEALWIQYDKDYAEYQKYLEKKDEEKIYHTITARLLDELSRALSSDSSKTTFLAGSGFNGIIGSHAGELFSKGGSILGSKIATTAQGATSSTEASVVAYQKETSHILALDAAADRVGRSPFDIASQNTLFGSIVHAFSNYLYTTPSLSSGLSSFSSILRSSFTSFLPGAFADNESSFQTSYGECPENDIYGNGFVCSSFSYPTVAFDLNHIESYIQGNPEKPANIDDFVEYNNNRTSNVGYLNDKIAAKITPDLSGKASQLFEFLKNKLTQFWDNDARFKDYFSTRYTAYSPDQLALIAGTAFTDGGEYKDAQAYSVLSRFLDQIGYYSEENTNPTAFSESFDRPGTGESPYIALLKETSTDFSTLNDAEYLAAISGMSEEEANVVLGYFAYESYLASIDYENRLAFGREETFDFENSIQFEETDPFEAELAVIAKNDHLKITRKDPTYAA